MTAITDRPAPPYLRELVLRRAQDRYDALVTQERAALDHLTAIRAQLIQARAESLTALMELYFAPEGIAYLSGGPMTITDVRVLAGVVARWRVQYPDPVLWDALEGRR